MAFDFVTLPNGLRIIGERMPSYRTVSLGLWVGAGSKYETARENGICHYLEHMAFKGTNRRSTRMIADAMDEMGGYFNAYTTHSCTCFFTKVIPEDLAQAIDLIADITMDPLLDPVEMEKEKGVVLEEIGMSLDTPEDLVHEMLVRAHFGVQGISNPILGTEESVRSFTREGLIEFRERMYRPENCVFSIAGCYDWNETLKLIEEGFGGWEKGAFAKPVYELLPAEKRFVARSKDIEQTHICLGFDALKQDDDNLAAYTILSSILGGANSSRLFQAIREESGLAYSVYSAQYVHNECGMLEIYAATGHENAKKVYDMILFEIDRLLRDGIEQAEFDKIKKEICSSLIMGDESTSAHMRALGRRMLEKGNTRTLEETLALYDAADLAITQEMAERILKQPHSRAILGRDEALSQF